MREIKAKLKIRRGAYAVQVKGRLELPFETRQKSRALAKLDSGEEVALKLPRGEVLRGGDLVVASDGGVIEVIAAPEDVIHVEASSPSALARAAYHLGNRHVAVEVGDGYLRIATDHVLEDMLRGLGATLTPMRAPFEPEAGAYGGGHHHHAGERGGGAKIHEYGAHDHAHGDGHGHSHHHDHANDHGHGHGDHHDHAHGEGHDHDHDHDHEHCDHPSHRHGHRHER